MRNSIFNELIEGGLLNENQLMECQEEERTTGKPIDKVLREKGYVSEEDFLKALSSQLHINFVEDLEEFSTPEKFVDSVPAQFERTYNLVAIDEEPEGLACVEDGGDMVPLPIVDWKAGMNLCSTPGSGAGRDPGEEMPRAAVLVTFASKAENEGTLTGDPIVPGDNIRDS